MAVVVLLSLYDALLAPPMFVFRIDEQSGGVESVAFHNNDNADGVGYYCYHRWIQLAYLILSLPVTVWGVYVVVRLRAAVRRRYRIPTGRMLGRYEDLVCVCLCNCCVLSQLARQTADYENGTERASCCSPTGIVVAAAASAAGVNGDRHRHRHHDRHSPTPPTGGQPIFRSSSSSSFKSSAPSRCAGCC
jgi:hypothetical protein